MKVEANRQFVSNRLTEIVKNIDKANATRKKKFGRRSVLIGQEDASKAHKMLKLLTFSVEPYVLLDENDVDLMESWK